MMKRLLIGLVCAAGLSLAACEGSPDTNLQFSIVKVCSDDMVIVKNLNDQKLYYAHARYIDHTKVLVDSDANLNEICFSQQR
jgi:hypothetical protein